jgi:regulator of cell morphogenesis and NO signaling
MNAEQTVGELVTERPSRSRVFAQHGIDFCCGGGKSLGAAAAAKGIEVDRLIADLEAAEAPGAGEPIFAEMSLRELTEYLVQTHHAYLRRELPRLREMVHKVARVHIEKDARLPKLVPVFDAFYADMLPHLDKEEVILFPAICDMESGKQGGNCFGHISGPISVMESDHELVGRLLVRMRELCDDYQVPAEACNTWRAMLDGLQELEADTHQHVHLENNILHKRAIELFEA